MTNAEKLYTAVPKLHNCAQAVMEGCGGAPDQVAELATCGVGRAPGGLCGALYAACLLCPAHAEEIKAEFAKSVGALTCHDIKTGPRTPCPTCVKTAAELVARFQ